MAPTQADIEEEQVHFQNVMTTFKRYAQYSLSANNRRRQDYYKLPQQDRQILRDLGYLQKLTRVDEAIQENAKFLDQVLATPDIFEADEEEEEEEYDEVDGADLHQGAPASHSHSHSHSHPDHTRAQSGAHPLHGAPDHGHSHGGGSDHIHQHGDDPNHSHSHDHTRSSGPYKPTEFDMDKLRSTLKQFVREWSKEGEIEREACYKPMKDALLEHFKDVPEDQRYNLRVLVPGAGLARLPFDIAKLGFSCQANEFSHYMLLSSFCILNRTSQIEQHTIYPYVHTFSNVENLNAMLRPIKIPDVLPSSLPPQVNFSLVAGDFEEIYGQPSDPQEPQHGLWNAVVTCFFIDTAKNLISYLRIINKILAPGGVWINLGPLLWHWENNSGGDLSIELTLEEVKQLVGRLGFRLDDERTIETTYTNNAQSMLGYIYKTAFWTATKLNDANVDTIAETG